MSEVPTIQIGSIGNYYGDLRVAQYQGYFFWGIQSWNGTNWEKISTELYGSLIRFEESRVRGDDEYKVDETADSTELDETLKRMENKNVNG